MQINLINDFTFVGLCRNLLTADKFTDLEEMKLLLLTGLGLRQNELHYNPPIVELILSVRFVTTESK